MTTDRSSSDTSLGQLVSNVTGNVSSLVRLEIELAKSEIAQQAKQGAVGGALAAAAAFLVVLTVILASIAAALGLSRVMPDWAAFLVVGGVYLLLAVILVLISKRRFEKVKGPERATAAYEETKSVLTARAQVRDEAKSLGMSVPELAQHEADERARTAAREAARAAAAAPTTSTSSTSSASAGAAAVGTPGA